MAIRSLGYVIVETADIEGWRRFAEEVLGALAVEHGDGLRLRFDDRPFRVWLRKADADRFYAAGWLYASKVDYDAGLEALRAADVALEAGGEEEARDRALREFVRCTDPSGNALEIGWGNVVDGAPFISPAGVSGFVMSEMGMGHIVLPAMELAATRAFYVELLGFGDSDEMRAFPKGGGPDDPGIGFHFLHCDNPRHHSLAIGEYPASSGMIHMMIEVHGLDDVGRAIDRAIENGAHISAGLGKHMNDKMVSFYVRSPSGFDVEYGTGGLRLDWTRHTPTISLKADEWGHHWNFGGADLPNGDGA